MILIVYNFLIFLNIICAPKFCDNYVVKTDSYCNNYQIISIPFFCTNDTRGCIRIANKKDGRIIYNFIENNVSGSVFVVANSGKIVYKIPIGIGLSPVLQIESSTNQPDSYIKIYQTGVLVDSLKIPAIHPVSNNESFFFTGKIFDRSNLIYLNHDTLSVITHRGLISIVYNDNKFNYKLNKDISKIDKKKSMKLDAFMNCFPYPQPTNCIDVPRLPKRSNRYKISGPLKR